MPNKFPDKFLFGAATSSHQVEGGNYNDWSEWEKNNAVRLAEEAESKFRHLPSWPRIKDAATSPENYISGAACDHYRRFREDFDLARSLGHNAHRFSIEWSRVEPVEGRFSEKEIEHYRSVIRSLRERGIEPFVTIWHWTIPLWLRDKGGWKSKNAADYFCRYVEKIVTALHEDVVFWITLNEPLVHAKISFLEGRWPPQGKNIFSFLRVSKNLIRAHNAAYGIIKKIRADSQVGIAHNMSFFEVEKNHVLNRILKKIGEWRKNSAFLNAISRHQDFIGFNYYSSYRVNLKIKKVETEETTDMGWAIYPKGIYLMLRDLQKYNKPIYITENGLADARDKKRATFIGEHLRWIAKAIDDGVDVRGYFHWSLLDNFEWSEGFWPRFGLIEVDYKAQRRTVRQSAREYARLIKEYSA